MLIKIFTINVTDDVTKDKALIKNICVYHTIFNTTGHNYLFLIPMQVPTYYSTYIPFTEIINKI